jgi:hypothetical protein
MLVIHCPSCGPTHLSSRQRCRRNIFHDDFIRSSCPSTTSAERHSNYKAIHQGYDDDNNKKSIIKYVVLWVKEVPLELLTSTTWSNVVFMSRVSICIRIRIPFPLQLQWQIQSQFTIHTCQSLVASLLSPVETIRIRFPFSATAYITTTFTVASSHAESTGNHVDALARGKLDLVIHVASVEWKCHPCLECILLYELSINIDKLVWKPENSSNSGSPGIERVLELPRAWIYQWHF